MVVALFLIIAGLACAVFFLALREPRPRTLFPLPIGTRISQDTNGKHRLRFLDEADGNDLTPDPLREATLAEVHRTQAPVLGVQVNGGPIYTQAFDEPGTTRVRLSVPDGVPVKHSRSLIQELPALDPPEDP